MKIVFLDRATIGPGVDIRRPSLDHEWIDYPVTPPELVVERSRGAAAVVVNKVPMTAETLAALPDLRLIAVAATGTDPIDLAAAESQGVTVRNVTGYAADCVPDHVFAGLLSLSRNLPAYRAAVRNGDWQKSEVFCLFAAPIRDLAGLTMGIVGRGTIGEGVARRAEAFGMNVIWAERRDATTLRPGYLAFEQVLARSDVLSLHCPLTEQTRHILDRAALGLMKNDAVLINTSRGGLVDEPALLAALESGRLGGAVIDVTSPEPPPADSAVMRLARREDVIVTPHSAWASNQAMQAVVDQLIDNIETFFR